MALIDIDRGVRLPSTPYPLGAAPRFFESAPFVDWRLSDRELIAYFTWAASWLTSTVSRVTNLFHSIISDFSRRLDHSL
jgi:hypothetical protein